MSRRLLVTHALPYANGPLHLGHMVGYVQADIWVRFQRMCGNEVTFVAGEDAHGTPIMLAAEKAGVSPQEFVAGIKKQHEDDFRDFGVKHDFYHSTDTPENKQLAERIYTALNEKDFIGRRDVEQAYDAVKGMFLPDRYVKGECPNCGTADQYGDNCENCGATYSARELKNPFSVLSGSAPQWKPSEHHFFLLSKLQDAVSRWLASANVHSSVKAKLREWLDAPEGLKDWDISRDAPYFGFEIPGAPGKFFYVWLDAPIGYFASLLAFLGGSEEKLQEFIGRDSTIEMWHFIGKDIVNFHGLFWPAMLHGAGMREPTGLAVNGYLTVNSAKMSKSRGTFIKARAYLDAGLNPEYLRYYFAAKLGAGVEDIDLNLSDFEARVKSDIVGKYVNIASRCAPFIEKYFDGRLAPSLDESSMVWWRTWAGYSGDIEDAYNRRSFAEVVVKIAQIADNINRRIDDVKPWHLAVVDGAMQGNIERNGQIIELTSADQRRTQLHAICTLCINAFRLLTIFLRPIMPALASEAASFLELKDESLVWSEINKPLLGTSIKPYKPLATRIDPAQIKAMTEASKENLAPAPPVTKTRTAPTGPTPPMTP